MNLKARLLGSWIGKQLLKDVTVTSIDALGPLFRRLTLDGIAAAGFPGSKLQVFIPEVGTRTFTPVIDPDVRGATDLIAYVHGAGPGARWAREVAVGDTVRVVPASASTPLEKFIADPQPVVLFGDETSLGIACSLLRVHRKSLIRLAVQNPDDVRPACVQLAILPDSVVAAGELAALAREIVAATDNRGTIVMTGSGLAIQTLRAELRALGSQHKYMVKAYWSPGKTGLD